MTPVKLSHVTMKFGGLKAICNLELEVFNNQIFGVIGPNGAGKTTVFNILTGIYTPTEGSVYLFGQRINHLKSHMITRLGIARTFQNIRLFKDLTVVENLLIALDSSTVASKMSLLSIFFASLRFKENEKALRKKANEILSFFRLDQKKDILSKHLPYGDQRRLEIARAVATQAKVLLLDEPAAGLNPTETSALMQDIRQLKQTLGLTIILIEHDMKLVMGICDRIAVLDHGMKIAEGPPESIQTNRTVIEAYLGKSHA